MLEEDVAGLRDNVIGLRHDLKKFEEEVSRCYFEAKILEEECDTM